MVLHEAMTMRIACPAESFDIPKAVAWIDMAQNLTAI
jgi:hypothetical protein